MEHHHLVNEPDPYDDLTELQSKPQVLTLVQYNQANSTYSITPQAKQFLNSLGDLPVAVLGMAGKARTGKSYLLNQLINTNTFPTHSHLTTCTKGIQICSKVFRTPNNTNYIVIDTEGLGASQNSQESDTKLFVLNTILCSTMLFNARGVIDEQTLNSLSVVVELAKVFQKEIDAKQADIQFPALMWLIRDFALKMESQYGFEMTPKDYLESALEEQKGVSIATANKNRIRKAIKSCFRDRDCVTFVRPVQNETDLQCIKEEQLREEFKTTLQSLRKKILGKLKIKRIKGKMLTGSYILQVLKLYLEAFNSGQIPKMNSIWNSLKNQEINRIRSSLIGTILKDIERAKTSEELEETRNNMIVAVKSLKPQDISLVGDQWIREQQQQMEKQIQCRKNSMDEQQLKRAADMQSKVLEEASRRLSQVCDLNILEQEFIRIREHCAQEVFVNRHINRQLLASKLTQIYMACKIQKLQSSKSESAKTASNHVLLELQYTKKENAMLLEKCQNMDRERHALLTTIETQQKCIEELRTSLSLHKRDASSKHTNSCDQNSSNYLAEKVLQMYAKLEAKHQDTENMLKRVSLLHCSKCDQTFDLVAFQMHSKLDNCNRVSPELTLQQLEPKVLLASSKGTNLPMSQNLSSKKISASKISIGKLKLEPGNHASFYTPYLKIYNPSTLQVEISKTLIKEDCQQRNYIEYTLEVSLFGQSWTASRKNKDFFELQEILAIMFPKMNFPASIVDVVMKNNNHILAQSLTTRKELVEERRKGLEVYLKYLISIEEIRNTRILQKFLRINKQEQWVEKAQNNVTENRSMFVGLKEQMSCERSQDENTGSSHKRRHSQSGSNSNPSVLQHKIAELRLKMSLNR